MKKLMMNLILWIVAGLLAIAYLVSGTLKLMLPKEKLVTTPGDGRTREREGDTMTEKIDVVVIGGGYAGIMADNRLRKRDQMALTPNDPLGTIVGRFHPHAFENGVTP